MPFSMTANSRPGQALGEAAPPFLGQQDHPGRPPRRPARQGPGDGPQAGEEGVEAGAMHMQDHRHLAQARQQQIGDIEEEGQAAAGMDVGDGPSAVCPPGTAQAGPPGPPQAEPGPQGLHQAPTLPGRLAGVEQDQIHLAGEAGPAQGLRSPCSCRPPGAAGVRPSGPAAAEPGRDQIAGGGKDASRGAAG